LKEFTKIIVTKKKRKGVEKREKKRKDIRLEQLNPGIQPILVPLEHLYSLLLFPEALHNP
jgi:hypothetical protein